MTEADFDRLRRFLRVNSGLALGPDKGYLAECRLRPVAERYGLDTLGAVIARLDGAGDAELCQDVIDAMSTNESFFFRDNAPFHDFAGYVLPQLLKARQSERRLRIWCAACAHGQEPYSVLMLLDQAAEHLAGWQVDLLATDISSEAIARARAGVYTQFEVQRGLPIRLLVKYFSQRGDRWEIKPALRERVQFRQLNLLHDFRGIGAQDVILCRNVLLYFDVSTKTAVLDRVVDQLPEDGFLYLGSTESARGLSERVVQVPDRHNLYRREPLPRAA